MYEAKPHIGTDKLSETVKNIRNDIILLGGEVIFGAKFCGYDTENGRIKAISYIKTAPNPPLKPTMLSLP